MEQLWINILTLLTVFTLAIVSPGPNFVLVVNRALTESRRCGIYTALGVATGSGLFSLAGLVGLLLIIHSLPYFADLVRLLGGGYLIYLGLMMFWSCRQLPKPAQPLSDMATGRQPWSAYCSGLLTNLTNPKAWAFYFSMFTLVADASFPFWAKVFLTCAMFSISFAWYSAMALVISHRRVQGPFFKYQPLLKALFGAILLFFGGRLLLKT